jgi:hypothetical protein
MCIKAVKVLYYYGLSLGITSEHKHLWIHCRAWPSAVCVVSYPMINHDVYPKD